VSELPSDEILIGNFCDSFLCCSIFGLGRNDYVERRFFVSILNNLGVDLFIYCLLFFVDLNGFLLHFLH